MVDLNPDILDIVMKDVLEKEVINHKELTEAQYEVLYNLSERVWKAMGLINPILAIFSSPVDFIPVVHCSLLVGEALGRHGVEAKQLESLLKKEGK